MPTCGLLFDELDDRVAAVDGDDGSGDVSGHGAGEEEGNGGNFIGLSKASERDVSFEVLDALLDNVGVSAIGAEELVEHRCLGGTGCDGVGADAIGATAGHLLECGAQITGGYYYDPGYKDIPDPANIGFPIAEIHADGRLFITKALRTGGLVNEQVVKEQLLYEIHDPKHYITPDVTLDFSGVTVRQAGPDRVEVSGFRGAPAPQKIKATVCFDGGWLGEGEISYAGPNCLARARAAGEVLLQRLKIRKLDVEARVDLIGVASVHSGDSGSRWRAEQSDEAQDIRVRLAVSARTQDDADQAAREALAMYCCGPAGGGGVRWRTTPRIRTQSYLMLPSDLAPGCTVQSATEIAP